MTRERKGATVETVKKWAAIGAEPVRPKIRSVEFEEIGDTEVGADCGVVTAP